MTPAAALELARRRQASLRIIGAPLDAAEDVVAWLGAVQSQDHAPATWSVAQRTRGARAADVDAAFAAGRILRTHVLRPTWHFVRPADLRWMLALTAPRIRRFMAPYDRRLGLDGKTLAKAHAIVARELDGGAQRTRRELEAALAAKKITGDGQRLAHLMMHAELDALVCSGAMRGKQHTYALVDDRVAPAPARTRDEALAELTARYFTSHGPATAKDLAWWASLTLADVAHGVALAGDRLEREEIDGVAYWSSGARAPRRSRTPAVHLLQGFDEYAVGYTESKYVLAIDRPPRPITPDVGSRMHLLALDTQLAGRWQRAIAKDAVTIEVALHAPFDRAQRAAVAAAADRFGRFLGLAARVVYTS